jgi:hypothetical protein
MIDDRADAEELLAAGVSEVPRCLRRHDAIHQPAAALAHRRLALELREPPLQLRHPDIARGFRHPGGTRQ